MLHHNYKRNCHVISSEIEQALSPTRKYVMKYSIFIFFVLFRVAVSVDCIAEARHSCPRFAHPEKTEVFCRRYQLLWECFHNIDPYCMEDFRFMYTHKCVMLGYWRFTKIALEKQDIVVLDLHTLNRPHYSA
ncbi:uncharacterized protein LOC128249826 isoform X2 [Octopus bimaculoides]|uniref:uncharacterized protein LOC128249826 isoform X2 n=1 Tax=Octopus bimaculoides TaxID=37653 RepID=UPI0022DEF134|nr:uncharacterized protein LOC128249826 isoform X2 [Octopus bimaculoides]